MNFSSISGILITLAALIWVAFIIPAWIQGGEIRATKRSAKYLDRKSLRASNSAVEVVTQVNRLKRLAFALVAAAGIVLSFGFALNSVFATIAGIAIILFSLVAFRRAFVVSKKLVGKATRTTTRQASVSKYLRDIELSSTPATNGWKPNALPEPMHKLNMNGSLEKVAIAEVKQLEIPKVEEQKITESIDEILRRRRAI
ncbi:MAG: hypothetical protein ACKOWE_05660 [Micrococcales bacterium]